MFQFLTALTNIDLKQVFQLFIEEIIQSSSNSGNDSFTLLRYLVWWDRYFMGANVS